MTQPWYSGACIQKTPVFLGRELLISGYHSTHHRSETELAQMSTRQLMDPGNKHNGLLVISKEKHKPAGRQVKMENIVSGEATRARKDKWCVSSIMCRP